LGVDRNELIDILWIIIMIIRFGCNKVLNCEFVGWANLLKEHLFDFSDFLRAFIFDRKHLTLSSKLKSLVSFVKNVVFYKKTSKIEIWMFYICLLFFLTVTKIYDYILNIWTDSLWKCQMFLDKSSSKSMRNAAGFAEKHSKPLQSRKL